MGKDLNGNELGTGFTQRQDGRYQARFTINGVKYCLYSLSLSDLRKDVDKKKRTSIGVYESDRRTTGEWWEYWYTYQKAPQLKSDISRAVYRRKCANTYIKEIGDIRLNKLTQNDIQLATNRLRETHTKDYIREGLGQLRECLDVAVVNRLIEFNPCVSINIKRNEYIMNERTVFTKEQQKMILEEAEGTYYEEAYKILLLTGMRIGEFSGLQWGDIDWDKKCIHISRTMSTGYYDHRKIVEITPPKTYSSTRTIPFFGETEEVLKSWKDKQDAYKLKLGKNWRCNEEFGDLVFTSSQGSPATRYVMQHAMKTLEMNMKLKYSNAPHVHPHAFRHTFATRCFEKGMSPLVVQKLMGHANYSTTVGYTHVEDTVAGEVRKIGDFLAM